MLLDKHSFTLQDDIDYKDGDLVVYKDNIAYKFDFEIKVPLSVIFDRDGECLDISTVRKDVEEEGDEEQSIDPEQQDKVAHMASNIADMISEINQEDM